jgi:hypothetical protein
MSWSAVAAAAGAVVGAWITSESIDSASDTTSTAATTTANAQLAAAKLAAEASMAGAEMSAEAIKEAAQISADVQWKMYEQAREDYMPWLKAGRKALGVLEKKIYKGPGEFEESPGYQFRLEQGKKTVLSAASATGGLASGRTQKALMEYGQEYASNEYDKFLARYYTSLSPLQSLAQVGVTTAGSLGQMGVATGRGIADTQMAAGGQLANVYSQAGVAQASGYMNQANILGNLYTNQANIAAQRQIQQGNIWGGAIQSAAGSLGSAFGKWYNTPASTTPTVNYGSGVWT